MLFKVQDKISFVKVSVYITTLFECIPIVTMSYPELVEFWLVWYYEKINLKVKAWMKTFFFVIASGGNVEQPLNFRGFTATSSIFRFFPSCIMSTKTKQKKISIFWWNLKRKDDLAAGNYTPWKLRVKKMSFCLCGMAECRCTLQCAVVLMLTPKKIFTKRLKVLSLNTDSFLTGRLNGFVWIPKQNKMIMISGKGWIQILCPGITTNTGAQDEW